MPVHASASKIVESLKKASPGLYVILSRADVELKGGVLHVIFSTQSSMYRFKLLNKHGVVERLLKQSGVDNPVIDMAVVRQQSSESGQPNNENSKKDDDILDEKPREDIDRIYLEYLHIENFRSIVHVDIHFKRDVNVIIGSNNSGKSTVIDAIRLALQVGKYRKSRYITIDDFQDPDKEIKIDLKFHCPDSVTGVPELKVYETSHEGKRVGYLKLHVVFYISKTGQVKQKFWGGNMGGKVPDDDALDIFSFDYLGALRNATESLKPSTTSKVADLLLNLRIATKDRQAIEKVFSDAQNSREVKALVKEANNAVSTHLSKIALRHDMFGVQLSPLSAIFEEIVGTFEMRLAAAGVVSHIKQNGLGYNNILYGSTVLGHVQSTKKNANDRFHTLLIEEPEAHLHPQLEDSFFSYLAKLGSDVESQVIATSHSAIISSTTDMDNLIILHKDGTSTSAINISSIDMSNSQKAKIVRYLDVTKSRMLFARSVVFVEGITEALLLPVLADVHFGEDDSLVNRGIEIVNIDGVSFEPYSRLYNNKEYSLPMRASIITDKDSYTDKKGKYHDISPRTSNTLSYRGHLLDVFTTEGRTLEVDLWNAGNSKAMQIAGSNLFTQSDINGPEDLIRLMNNSKEWGKGDLAQELLEGGFGLSVPNYIAKALDWADGNDSH